MFSLHDIRTVTCIQPSDHSPGPPSEVQSVMSVATPGSRARLPSPGFRKRKNSFDLLKSFPIIALPERRWLLKRFFWDSAFNVFSDPAIFMKPHLSAGRTTGQAAYVMSSHKAGIGQVGRVLRAKSLAAEVHGSSLCRPYFQD